MSFMIINRRDQDLGRGVALVVAGALMGLLKWILPAVAPLALAAYGIYSLVKKNFSEGLVALVLAVIFWFLMIPLGWLIWVFGALMAGFGLFFLIRGFRSPRQIE